MQSKEIMRLLESRRTYRRFDESRKISDEVVADMMYACRIASSAMNSQPFKYIYVRTPDTVNRIFELTSWGAALPNGAGRPREGERPVMFVVVLSAAQWQTKFTEFDAGLAVSNMTLAAWSHGVGSCILGSARIEKLSELLDVGEGLEIRQVIGFGYPTHTSRIEDSDGTVKYRLDEQGNYVVPKRTAKDTVTEL